MLYIGGTGRTGSTVLQSLLGSFPGVFSAGELTFFWQYCLRDGGRCSCGRAVRDCPVWSRILMAAFGESGVDVDRMVELRRRFWSGHLPFMLSPWYRRRGLDRLEEYPRNVERLYRGIAEATDAELIVDSSKEPHYSYILRERTGLDLYFLQLVRDPRAVGMSWRRKRRELSTGEDSPVALAAAGAIGYHNADQRGSFEASLYYNVSNVAGELLWRSSDRYAFMRYEDFVARPDSALDEISRFVGVDLDVASVLDADKSFQRPALHSSWGNPNRFQHDRTSLRPDDAWISTLPGPSRAVLTVLNSALMSRYGYPLRGAPGDLRAPCGRLRGRQFASDS